MEQNPQTIGLIGLGKMGANIARRLVELGVTVHAFNRTWEVTEKLQSEGVHGHKTVRELVQSLPAPRLLWIMLPAGQTVDDMLFGPEGVMNYVQAGDIVIDAGNSYYQDTVRRQQKVAAAGVHYIDIGVSGGPGGARSGPALMVGAAEELPVAVDELCRKLALPGGYQFFPGSGAGHFVKMVHNGIEYGMMQAIGEGFAIMKQSSYDLDLEKVADLYNHGSVIVSRLIGWLADAYRAHGTDLTGVSGSVAHTGEGAWTVQTAEQLGVPAKVIADSLQFRIDSQNAPSYTGKVVSALREQFGGHNVSEGEHKQ